MKIAKLAPLLLAIPLASSAAPDYLKKGELLTTARTQQFNDKWEPIPRHLDSYADVATDLKKKKIVEADICSMDTSSCILYYRKGEACLRLYAEGPAIKIMKVTGWSDDCPEPLKTPYLKEGELFTTARAQLLQDKWTPIPMHLFESEERPIAHELVKRNVTEVYACSKGTSNCTLYYRKESDCIELDTIGDHLKKMRLQSWSNECPLASQESSLHLVQPGEQ